MMGPDAGSARAVIREGTRRLQAAGVLLARPSTARATRIRDMIRTVQALAGVNAQSDRINPVGGGARHEAEWLLSRLVNASPLELYLREEELPQEAINHFFAQIEARAAGAPLQYLLGETEFCGTRCVVAPGVFIPRPETEAIVEAAVETLRARAANMGRALRVLDLGTGSGCIAVALAKAVSTCVVVGVELSWKALCIARRNVERHDLEGRVHLVHGQWTDALRGAFDGIISNPPYVPSAHVDCLPLDVRQEPRLSLDGGPDGMRVLFQLMALAPRLLAAGGIMALECGEEQVTQLLRAVQGSPWVASVKAVHDLAGRPRGILIHAR